MTSSFSYNPPPISHSDSLLTALFIAAVVHAIILMGLNFSIPEPEKVGKSIEITLSNTPAKKAPKKAEYLAQDNQIGAGKENKKPEAPKQKLPSHNSGKRRQPAPRKSASKAAKASKKVTVKQAVEKIETANKPVIPAQASQPKPQLTAASLQKQIAQLGEQIRQSQSSAEQNKIKFVNSVSTHKYIAAQYMKDWENKVERTGNLNYPEVARKKGFSGTLTMDVGINADGSIYSIRITKSSGNQALDDAAKRIVQMSAPFAALPAELLQELDVLVITRVWKFSDESGMTTR
ncbi:TonB family protein [Methylomarinum sp. Ch1-1]|uniref:TonB family protein n=1 Tax=Methylomarinum roseum TaxID=3067653 RepID=A0AAU7NXQ9_9GAMM